MNNKSHNDLCAFTANHFIKSNKIVLYNYQSYASFEFPDVLAFGNNISTLYEIKTSHSDFLADSKKEVRKKWKPKNYLDEKFIYQYRMINDKCPKNNTIISINSCKKCNFCQGVNTKQIYNEENIVKELKEIKCTFDGKAKIEWINKNPELYYIEYPHLGNYRYYVCEKNIIMPEEIQEGWGLYWIINNKFYEKKESKKWKVNLFEERNILIHSFRKWVSGDKSNILINSYNGII